MDDQERQALIERAFNEYKHETTGDNKAYTVGEQTPEQAIRGTSAGFLLLLPMLFFIGSFFYLIYHFRAQSTIMLTHNGESQISSSFPEAALIWGALAMMILFSSSSKFSSKLCLAIILGVLGSLVLTLILDSENNARIETAAFANGAIETTEILPITGVSMHRGKSTSYQASFITPHEDHRGSVYISEADYTRMRDTPHNEHYMDEPTIKYCMTAKIQTAGENMRMMWPKLTTVPSSAFSMCSADQISTYHTDFEATKIEKAAKFRAQILAEYTPAKCAKEKQERADQLNAAEQKRITDSYDPQNPEAIANVKSRHYTAADVEPIRMQFGQTVEVVCD